MGNPTNREGHTVGSDGAVRDQHGIVVDHVPAGGDYVGVELDGSGKVSKTRPLPGWGEKKDDGPSWR